MSDQQSPEDWRRERALAALARAMRGDDEDAPGNLPARQKTAPGSSAAEITAPPLEKTTPSSSKDIWQKHEAILRAEAREKELSEYQDKSETFDSVPSDAADTTLQSPKLPLTPSITLAEEAKEEQFEAPLAFVDSANESMTEPLNELPTEKNTPEAAALVRPGIATSRPLIMRLTLLGALTGIAAALLLWKPYGAIAAFLPFAGLLSGLGAGLVAALFQSKIVVNPQSTTGADTAIAHDLHEQVEQPNPVALGHPPTTDEIRASLRQFRAATQDLARSRTPR
ncbi:hypothetical protein ACFPLB_02215 [Aquamicrobium segne]|uniref:Uncharacterized protein n=1 Tax=Aquamicrobium segne TaxID=469547 RepID=A0ABW0GT27_9HYPH